MRLFREISLSSSVFLVIGNIIGVGIFTTSGLIAETLGSSLWVIGVWILGGILALTGAACYSLLARRLPRAGGEYAFLYPVYGPLPAFLSGWSSLLIGFSAPMAAGALGLSEYLSLYLPQGLAENRLAIKAAAAAAVLAVSAFISLGLRFGAGLHSLVTALNLVLILGFSFVVLTLAPVRENLAPLVQSGVLEVDWGSLGAVIILVMFGYSGWNASAYVAEEVCRPERNIPLSLLFGTVAVTGTYLLANLAYFGAGPLEKIAGQVAVARVTASQVLGAGGIHFVNLLILTSILSSLTAMSIAGPRVYFAMARDRLFPTWLSHVDARRKLPLRAIWFQSGVALLLIAASSFREILLYAGTVMMLFTTLTVSTLFAVAPPARGATLSFRLLYRLLPAFFVACNVLVLVSAAWSSSAASIKGAITVATGLPVYLYFRTRQEAGEPV